MSDQAKQAKGYRERSPNYPGIPLNKAVDRAEVLYGIARRNAAPAKLVLERWGYSPKSGAGMVTLAAVKHFGLIEDEGRGDNRQVKLSDGAITIILSPHGDERAAAIKAAALRPAMHRVLWEKYGSELPSQDVVRYYLLQEHGFSENGARDLIHEYRETIQFAGLEGSDTLDRDESASDANRGEQDMSTLVKTPSSQDVYAPSGPNEPWIVNLPLSPERLVVLHIPRRMSQSDWELLRGHLDLIERATLAHADPDDEGAALE